MTVIAALVACGPKLAPSVETREIELEIDEMMTAQQHARREPWRSVELDENRTAFIDVEIPREGCNLLVVLTDGEGEVLELRRDPVVSLGAPGLSWFPVCADDPGVHNLATTIVARAPMSRALHLAIFTGPGREGAEAMRASYLPDPTPAFVPSAPQITAAPGVEPIAGPESESSATQTEGATAPDVDCGVDPRETARGVFRTGREAAERGELDAAAEAFDLAYACVPDGTILMNAAAVHARRGDADTAVKRYERMLREHGEGLTRVMRRQVEDALEALRRPVRVVVQAPSGYVVTLGGVVLERGEGRVVPGTYEVTWRRREDRRVAQVVVAPGGRTNVPFPASPEASR